MAEGIPVRYADFGKSQQTVLLLHGYLESIEVWDDFASELGKSHRVIMLDLPGHGFSGFEQNTTQAEDQGAITTDYMARIAVSVLDKAGVGRCTVVGHSMGGYVALAMAALCPERLEGLVLFHSSPNADSPDKAVFRQREIEIIKAGKKEMLATVNPGRGFSPDNLKRCAVAIDELSQQIMLTEDDAIIATLKGLGLRPDRNAMMRELKIPKLMIFGLRDNYIPVENAQAMALEQPDAAVAWLERSGHMGFIEQKGESLAILRDFLDLVRDTANVASVPLVGD